MFAIHSINIIKIWITILIVLSPVLADGQDNNSNSYIKPNSVYLQKYSAIKNFELGVASFDKDQYKNAIEHFDASIYKNASDPKVYYARAMAKESLGMKMGALTDYTITLELDETHSEALLSRGLLNYAIERYEVAIIDFNNYLKLPKGNTNTVFYRSSLFNSGTDKVMTAQGIRSEIFNYLGMAYSKAGNYEEAIQHFDSACAIFPQPDYFVNRGVAHAEAGQVNAAIRDYQKALKLDPNNGLASYNLATLARESGNANLALETYDKAIEQDPDLAFAYTERGNAKLSKGDYKGALSDYQSALQIDHSDPEKWFNLALVKEKLNNHQGAYDDYSKVIDLNPQNDKAYFGRGNILMKLGQLKEAVDNYSIAIFYNPDYGLAYYNRAIVNYQNHQTQAACQDAFKARDLNVKQAENFLHKICK